MNERILPGNVDFERLILGGLMVQPDQFPLVNDLLSSDDFLLEKHKVIFKAMSRLYESGGAIDRFSIRQELDNTNQLQSVDGFSYILSLDDGMPQVVSLPAYCKSIAEKAVLRRAIIWADAFATRCERDGDSADLVIDAEKFTELVSQSTRRSLEAMEPLEVQEASGGANEFLQPSLKPGIAIPFPTINTTLSGFRKSKLIIVAARPAVGKSAFAWQCAEHAAMAGHRVLFVATEMSNRDLLHRGIIARSGVSAYKFRRGELNQTERMDVQNAWADLSSLGNRLLLCDKPDATFQSISALCRSLVARGKKPDLVFVDYIQQLSVVGRHESKNLEVTAIVRGLHLLSRQLDVPVIALSQLSRDMEKTGREPQNSDLRDSGSLEQEAHQIIFLWAKDDAQTERDPMRTVKWKCSKNRDGMLNRGALSFQRATTRFYEQESYEEEVA